MLGATRFQDVGVTHNQALNMTRTHTSVFSILSLLALVSAPLSAQGPGGRRGGGRGAQEAVDLSDAVLVNSISPRSIGPAVMSGRVIDIAVASSPGARGGSLGTVIYIAAASGGVWKSTSGGVTWDPVFDDGGVGSIGAVATAPSNSEIVWVGTGEANNQRSSSYGDGVYKSVDGGETFQNMGLHTSQHIAGIRVHPDDPNTVYVAALGPSWASGGERGVFKTTDGGETWENVLFVDEFTGATDIMMDPRDPDVLYAATLQRERRAYSYIGGGPGSGIYKSVDGGDSWTELTRGLPTSDMGRIGLDISLSQPRTLYAIIEGSEQGMYRSDNEGATWRKTSDIASIPWYFGEVRVDPTDPEVVYHLGVLVQRSIDGGENFEGVTRQVHSDQHALWINPENRDHLILGNDGGLYVSHDRGATWDFSPNLPISQFYAVGMDMAEPFFGVYGGLQDNSTWGGPSRTRNSIGIPNSDWFRMAGGDGFYAAVDPTDANIAYVESQNGNLIRYDRRTGDRKGIRPAPAAGEAAYRFNWSAPIQVSPWDHNTIYFAANHLFKSTDRGDTWQRLGEDLTQAIDRDELRMFGEIPGDDAVSRHQGVAAFGNISTIDISTVQRGLLITGSDDGTISISTDDGASWAKQTRFPGVRDTTYVSRVRLSNHDASVIYATFDGHRSNDFQPHVLKSTDQGRSWSNISNDLPEFGSVRAFVEHPGNPDLVFVGTEIAPFVSLDGGDSWNRMENGMPPVPIHDLKIHARDNALVIATHGRGFYIIDDLGPLEHLAEARAAGGAFLFPVESALGFVPDPSMTSGTSASRNYSPRNPPVGATISYFLAERASGLSLEVTGPSGEVVRDLEAPSGAGLHQLLWDLRVDAPYSGPPQPRPQGPPGGGFGGFGGFGGGAASGALTVPGRYVARLRMPREGADAIVIERPFEVLKDANVTLSDAQLAELFDLRMQQLRLNATLQMAQRNATAMREQITQARTAMESVEVSDELEAMAEDLQQQVDDARRSLGTPRRGGFGGGGGGGGEAQRGSPTIQQRLGTAGGIQRSMAMPTAQEREALESVPADLDAAVEVLNEVTTTGLPAFFRALDEAGVPWTPGRLLR